jgi:hypothetical protein
LVSSHWQLPQQQLSVVDGVHECFAVAVMVRTLRQADKEAVCHVTMNRNDLCNVFVTDWKFEYLGTYPRLV